jgi:hypothetical protein
LKNRQNCQTTNFEHRLQTSLPIMKCFFKASWIRPLFACAKQRTILKRNWKSMVPWKKESRALRILSR